MTEDVEILKQDRRGRVRVPVERREELLDEFERSGMSAAAFAAFVGVKYQTFITWRRKRKRSGQRPKRVSEPDGGIRWLEAVVADPPPVRAGAGPSDDARAVPGLLLTGENDLASECRCQV